MRALLIALLFASQAHADPGPRSTCDIRLEAAQAEIRAGQIYIDALKAGLLARDKGVSACVQRLEDTQDESIVPQWLVFTGGVVTGIAVILLLH